MERFVLNGSESTDDRFNAALFQTQHDAFSVLVVAAQRLAVAMEHEITYLLTCMALQASWI
jgi:hypothetical protein